ncbi:MAG: ABC transporter permease [Christensenellales bacterium]|jgi:ribose transport system permease protein|nr:ABC transporter permease [Clostridiales bacterium]
MTQPIAKKKSNLGDLLMKLGPLMVLALLYVIFAFTRPGRFISMANQMNILKQTAVNCLIGSGMLLALITAGIDLSVGYNAILATCTIGVLMQNFGITSAWILIPAAILVSTFAGFMNGTLLTRLDLPHPFVSTLGMKNVLWGLALLITSSKTIGFTNKGIDDVLWIGRSTFDVNIFGVKLLEGFPASFILVLLVYLAFHVFLNHTALGRQIYCVGGNPEAARMSGIRSKNVLTVVYTISGLMCGIAGVVLAGRLNTANTASAATYDTDAIAACIIGGASFRGGKGTIWGTMLGALLISTIRNGLNLFSAGNDIQYIVIGSVIILAVTIDVTRGKVEARARKLATL